MPHRNAPLTETARLRLARCVVDDGWPVRRAAERFQVSPTTAARWAACYRQPGPAGMTDRSSRPHCSPNQAQPAPVLVARPRTLRQHPAAQRIPRRPPPLASPTRSPRPTMESRGRYRAANGLMPRPDRTWFPARPDTGLAGSGTTVGHQDPCPFRGDDTVSATQDAQDAVAEPTMR
jgi:transposase-like protein